eukprot:TRINITY_DN3184_c0_g1_i1.p1 TRINITY_DN3184_c0_g1~~TRINITY_DN3184_c0_g1_i1.p1  ORF type:complete len:449 (+),score=44.82 TRINITY_DN3184_c0_g1_i1:143-1348(+)
MAEEIVTKRPRISERIRGEQGGSSDAWAQITALGRKPGVMNLGQGFTDEPGHPTATAGAKAALDKPLSNQYSAQPGTAQLREAIQQFYTATYGAPPDRAVCVTTGGTEAIFAIMQVILDPGDEVITFEPCFPFYGPCIRLAQGTPVPLRLDPPNFTLPLEQLKQTIGSKTRAIIFNTPHNPTGHCATKEEVEALARLCIDHDIYAISDEVYETCLFGGAKHNRLGDFPGMQDRTLTIGSASKLLSLTGWRVGWVTGPDDLVEAIRMTHAYVTYCAPTPLQEGIARAIQEVTKDRAWLEKTSKSFEENCHVLSCALKESGVTVCPPDGGYFLVADVAATGMTGVEYVTWLAEERGVVALPLSVCYSPSESPPPALVRFAICKDKDTVARAAEAIRRPRSRVG